MTKGCYCGGYLSRYDSLVLSGICLSMCVTVCLVVTLYYQSYCRQHLFLENKVWKGGDLETHLSVCSSVHVVKSFHLDLLKFYKAFKPVFGIRVHDPWNKTGSIWLNHTFVSSEILVHAVKHSCFRHPMYASLDEYYPLQPNTNLEQQQVNISIFKVKQI